MDVVAPEAQDRVEGGDLEAKEGGHAQEVVPSVGKQEQGQHERASTTDELGSSTPAVAWAQGSADVPGGNTESIINIALGETGERGLDGKAVRGEESRRGDSERTRVKVSFKALQRP